MLDYGADGTGSNPQESVVAVSLEVVKAVHPLHLVLSEVDVKIRRSSFLAGIKALKRGRKHTIHYHIMVYTQVSVTYVLNLPLVLCGRLVVGGCSTVVWHLSSFSPLLFVFVILL